MLLWGPYSSKTWGYLSTPKQLTPETKSSHSQTKITNGTHPIQIATTKNISQNKKTSSSLKLTFRKSGITTQTLAKTYKREGIYLSKL